LHKLQVWIQAAGFGQHPFGEIGSERADAAIAKIPRDLCGTAPKIADEASAADAFGQAVEDLAIERLAREFAIDFIGVLAGDHVVAFPDAPPHQIPCFYSPATAITTS
jgi:hypothetical protein